MARFRDLIGTSRKYAVPLLEWFDAVGITIRSGDVRTLRGESVSPRAAASIASGVVEGPPPSLSLKG
jgi:hypothetical protein